MMPLHPLRHGTVHHHPELQLPPAIDPATAIIPVVLHLLLLLLDPATAAVLLLLRDLATAAITKLFRRYRQIQQQQQRRRNR